MNTPLNSTPTTPSLSDFMDRRGFLRKSAAVGAGAGLFLATSKGAIAQGTAADRVLKVGLVGCGAQGQRLLDACKDIPGLEFIAVCDIWNFARGQLMGRFRSSAVRPNEYEDIEEMLQKEKDLECVLIASPDFMHAKHTRLALQAGKSVYCEKMMANTIEAAADMVRAQRETGGILQIGHQRHSNPRYLHLRDNVLRQGKMLGRVTHCYGQWNRGVSASQPQSMPKKYEIPADKLAKYGFNSGEEFRNWRFYRKYGAGPISDLGAHQIDMFNWFAGTTPTSVMAMGGVDYYDGLEGRPKFELEDNVMAMYEYKTPDGIMRAYYQVLTTSGSQGYFEKLMGVDGSVTISESPTYNQIYREPNAASWEQFAQGPSPFVIRSPDQVYNKFWEKPKPWTRPKSWMDVKKGAADSRESKALESWILPVILTRPPHAPHLENFFTSVRRKDPSLLNCNVEEAYRACVTVLKCNESIRTGAKYVFKPEDFTV